MHALSPCKGPIESFSQFYLKYTQLAVQCLLQWKFVLVSTDECKSDHERNISSPISDSNSDKKIHNTIQRNLENSFKCSNCNASFDWKSSLKRHVRTVHEKNRPFQCNVCDKKFHTNVQLKIHNESNHPFKCKVCSKKFIAKLHLKTHNSIHHQMQYEDNERKKLECPICQSKFSEIRSLSIHMKKFHSAENEARIKAIKLAKTSKFMQGKEL